MADLTEIQSTLSVKLAGADSSGSETNFVNADSNGNLQTINPSDGPVTPGTVALKSSLSGGQFNTALPTLSNGQQSAMQLDSSGRLIIAPLTNSSIVKAQLQDNAGSAITLGQKLMAASVPIVIASDQSTLPISAAALPLPAGAATAANQATEITSLQLIDDIAHAQNATLSKGVPAMGQLDDTGTTAATEDAVAVVRITPQRALHSNLRNQAGTEVGTTTTPVKTQASDGTDLQSVSSNGEAAVVDGVRAGGVYGRVSIPTSGTPVEMKVGASRLANRKFLQITCNQAGLFWGLDNTVTTTSGTPLANSQVLSFVINPDASTFQIWLVGNANSKTVQVVELP